jgi:ubiquinone biosynthesis protein UbiJ
MESKVKELVEYIDEAIEALQRFPKDAEILYCIRTYKKCKTELERLEKEIERLEADYWAKTEQLDILETEGV